jgi:hypothetical protein
MASSPPKVLSSPEIAHSSHTLRKKALFCVLPNVISMMKKMIDQKTEPDIVAIASG